VYFASLRKLPIGVVGLQLQRFTPDIETTNQELVVLVVHTRYTMKLTNGSPLSLEEIQTILNSPIPYTKAAEAHEEQQCQVRYSHTKRELCVPHPSSCNVDPTE
jgi:hypothetical protein